MVIVSILAALLTAHASPLEDEGLYLGSTHDAQFSDLTVLSEGIVR